jgi:hypothetical protein
MSSAVPRLTVPVLGDRLNNISRRECFGARFDNQGGGSMHVPIIIEIVKALFGF